MYSFYNIFYLIKSFIGNYLFNKQIDKSNINSLNYINENIKKKMNNDIILDRIEIENNFSEIYNSNYKSNKIIEKIKKEKEMIELDKIIDLININELNIILDKFNFDINKNMDIQQIIDFLCNEKNYITENKSMLQNTINLNFINDLIIRLMILKYVYKKIN
jgi:hypothetical protein